MANMTSSVSASQVAGELASATFEEIPALVEHYREDPRQQVIKACERALKRHAKELAERERVNDMYELMHELGGDGVVVGVDEVGRGSVAGPLTVCAVCLPMEPRVWGINDSKKLTPARRELLSVKIAEVATAIVAQFPSTTIESIADSVDSYKAIDAWTDDLKMTESSFTRLQDIMERAGELDQRVPFDKLVNNQYAAEAKR